MRIKISVYPITLRFTTDTKLPDFEYGCQVRTKIMKENLAGKIPYSCPHGIDDFIVEQISTTRSGETWHLGS